MLGRLLLGVLLAVAVMTITVSYLSKDKIKEELQNNDCIKGEIKKIAKSDSVAHIELAAIKEDGEEITLDIVAEDYDSSQICEGDVIYA